MENEMLEQIQQMITAAANSLGQDFRQEMAAMESRLDGRMDRIEQTQRGMESHLGERIEETKRHSGVLVEGLRHELQLVAEGLQMHIEQRHQEERTYMDRQFQETRGLIQISYRQLNERMEGLEQRMRTIEQQ